MPALGLGPPRDRDPRRDRRGGLAGRLARHRQAGRLDVHLQVDAVEQLTFAQAKEHQGKGDIQVLIGDGPQIVPMTMAADLKPFTDVRVRQAFRLMAYRPALIKGAQTFDEVFVLTGGGPGTATLMVVQYIYETAFSNQVQNFGLAAAASVVLGVVLFVLTLLQFAAARRKEV